MAGGLISIMDGFKNVIDIISAAGTISSIGVAI